MAHSDGLQECSIYRNGRARWRIPKLLLGEIDQALKLRLLVQFIGIVALVVKIRYRVVKYPN